MKKTQRHPGRIRERKVFHTNMYPGRIERKVFHTIMYPGRIERKCSTQSCIQGGWKESVSHSHGSREDKEKVLHFTQKYPRGIKGRKRLSSNHAVRDWQKVEIITIRNR